MEMNMKRFTTAFLMAAGIAMVAEPALAQESDGPSRGGRGRRWQGPGRGEGRPRFARSHPLMMTLDANEDGTISADEMEKATEALKSLDKNDDGTLTPEELSPFVGREFRRHGVGDGRRTRRFGGPGRGGRGGGEGRREGRARRGGDDRQRPRFQRRGPGVRRFGRGEGFGNRRFGRPGARRRGRRGDGRGRAGNFAERIMSYDKNEDGKVTKDELPEPMQPILDRIDGNDDGAIDKEEIEKIGERFRGRFRGRRGRSRGDGPRGDTDSEEPEEDDSSSDASTEQTTA